MSVDACSAIRALRPGMRLYVPGSVSEPRTLLEALLAEPERARGVHVVSSFVPGLNTIAATAFKHAASLTVFMCGPPLAADAGPLLLYRPMAWSAVGPWLAAQSFDMAWFQVCPPDAQGESSLGLGADFVHEVTPRAAQLIVEINESLPPTRGHETLPLQACQIVRSTAQPLQLAAPALDHVARSIGNHAAALVRDGDTLQVGIGKLMSSTLRELRSHRHLGLHSGLAGDEVFELMACGAMDGSRKSLDPGWAVTAGVAGGEFSLEALRAGAAMQIRPSGYTHCAGVLQSQDRLTAINGALEVDLLGQVNVEWAGTRRLSSPGGFPDFVRGARRAHEGRAIVLLQATTSSGASRIVPRLAGPVAATATDNVTVVTEFGVAELQGLDEPGRAAALIEVAAPQHRDALLAAAARR